MHVTSGARTTAWLLAAVMLLANVAGYGFDLYQRVWWFDRILHACTLFAMTYWAAVFLCSKVLDAGAGYWWIRLLVIASIGIAIGAIWEVAEWGFDQVMPANVIKGKYDTVVDLIVDTIGAVLAAWLSLTMLRAPAPPVNARREPA